MRFTLYPAVLALALMAGCSNRDTARNTADRDADASRTGMSDSEMTKAIQTRLDADADLNSAGVKASANAGKDEVTLTGTVASEDLRSRAVRMTQGYRPSLRIVDKIDVKPAEIQRSAYTERMAGEERERARVSGAKVGNSIEDAWIHTKISAKLAAQETSSLSKISVDVVDQNVILRGTVKDSAVKADAGRIATSTDGVKRVTNLLKVG